MKVEKLSATVTLFHTDSNIAVKSPYDRGFIEQVKSLGGRWNSSDKRWEVPRELEQKLKEILATTYGTPLDTAEAILKIKFDPHFFEKDDEVWVGGKRVCWRRGRDSGVSFADGSYLLEGTLPSSAGSRNNPSVFEGYAEEGEYTMVTSIPESVYAALSDEQKEATEIIEKTEGTSELEQLKAKKAKLKDELKALEEKIAALEKTE